MDISVLNRRNFSGYDFYKSPTAEKNSILNIPTAYYTQLILDNLKVVADKAQEIRDFLKTPIIINSGFRCIELNKLVGGKETSQHINGEAIDFICPKFKFGDPEQVVLAIKKAGIKVDQCLVEKSWVHLSIKKYGNRNQFGRYIDGVFSLI